MTSVVESERGSRDARLAYAALAFQMARITLLILALGVVVTLVSPHDVQQPYITPWQYAILGAGAWGFIISYVGFHYFGGQLAWWRFVGSMFSRARV